MESSPRVSSRRIKDAAKELRRLLAARVVDGPLGESESQDWAARMMGFSSAKEASDRECSGPVSISPVSDVLYGRERVPGFLGRKREREVFLTPQAMLGHEVVVGATGAGKTEALLTRAGNFLGASRTAGLLYVDGKGDSSIFHRMAGHCQRAGREVPLTLNLMSRFDRGGMERDGERLSNRFNPLDGMDGDETERWLWSVFGSYAKSKGAGREAGLLFAAAAFAHAATKGNGGSDPGVAGLAAWMSLRRLERVFFGPREALPAEAWERVDALAGAIGHDWSSGLFPVAEMSCEPILRSWMEVWPHVFATERGPDGTWLSPEVPRDAILHGSVVMVLLPALEKSPVEMGLVGRGISASMVSSWRQGRFGPGCMRALAVFDEIGYYAPDSYRAVMESARRAGVGVVFSGQDMVSLCKGLPWVAGGGASWGDAEERLSDLCGCVIKSLMKTDDPGGETRRLMFSAFGTEAPEMDELRGQRAGEVFMSMPGVLFKGNADYRDSRFKGDVRLSRTEVLPVPSPEWRFP